MYRRTSDEEPSSSWRAESELFALSELRGELVSNAVRNACWDCFEGRAFCNHRKHGESQLLCSTVFE